MDAERFDAVTKALLSVSPRRAALRVLGGLGLAALLGLADAEAKNKKNHNNKKKNDKDDIKPSERCEKNGKKLGKCVKGAFNKDGYCKCRGCHYGGACFPSCGGKCCDVIEDCCTGKGGEQVCHLQYLTCGPCETPCPGGKCCPVGKYCCRAADYTEHCTDSPGGGCP